MVDLHRGENHAGRNGCGINQIGECRKIH
jgi:hypothetical protein